MTMFPQKACITYDKQVTDFRFTCQLKSSIKRNSHLTVSASLVCQVNGKSNFWWNKKRRDGFFFNCANCAVSNVSVIYYAPKSESLYFTATSIMICTKLVSVKRTFHWDIQYISLLIATIYIFTLVGQKDAFFLIK